MADIPVTASFVSDKKYCIYLHKNKINGKCYVGQTCQKPEYRWNHGKGYIKNEDFYEDIKTYGWEEGFEHIILENNLSETEVDNREQYWITYYDAYQKGYNQNEGGHCPHQYSDKAIQNFKKIRQEYWDSEQGQISKQKLSQSLKDFYQSSKGVQLKQHLSESKQGINNPNYGKKHTKENIQKMSECKKGELNPNYNKKGIKNHRSLPVYCFELNQFFGSGQEAQRLTGADASSISRCCRGKANKAGNKHWRYATEEEILKLKKEVI